MLLWLYQDASGEGQLLEDGEETKIYPGCVSNPEPHKEIGKRNVAPIEMAWYMLAIVENYASLDAGITENLERFLPKGPALEGQMILSKAKIHKAMTRLDIKQFIDALKDTISIFAFAKASDYISEGLDIKKVTYGTFPLATVDQQEKFRDLTEQFILLYFSMCILKDTASIAEAVQKLAVSSGFSVRPVLLDCLQSKGTANDFYTDFAQLVLEHANSVSGTQKVSPREVFEFAYKVLEMGKTTGTYRLFSESLLPWLEQKWKFIQQHQRFLLSHPSLHESAIEAAINQKNVSVQVKVIDLLSAILPTLGFTNQNELEQILSSLPR